MSAGIRPSSDRPVAEYYFQPWWAKEIIRIAEILEKIDLTILSERDVKLLTKAAKIFSEKFPES